VVDDSVTPLAVSFGFDVDVPDDDPSVDPVSTSGAPVPDDVFEPVWAPPTPTTTPVSGDPDRELDGVLVVPLEPDADAFGVSDEPVAVPAAEDAEDSVAPPSAPATVEPTGADAEPEVDEEFDDEGVPEDDADEEPEGEPLDEEDELVVLVVSAQASP
jgi:hypothetical protein